MTIIDDALKAYKDYLTKTTLVEKEKFIDDFSAKNLIPEKNELFKLESLDNPSDREKRKKENINNNIMILNTVITSMESDLNFSSEISDPHSDHKTNLNTQLQEWQEMEAMEKGSYERIRNTIKILEKTTEKDKNILLAGLQMQLNLLESDHKLKVIEERIAELKPGAERELQRAKEQRDLEHTLAEEWQAKNATTEKKQDRLLSQKINELSASRKKKTFNEKDFLKTITELHQKCELDYPRIMEIFTIVKTKIGNNRASDDLLKSAQTILQQENYILKKMKNDYKDQKNAFDQLAYHDPAAVKSLALEKQAFQKRVSDLEENIAITRNLVKTQKNTFIDVIGDYLEGRDRNTRKAKKSEISETLTNLEKNLKQEKTSNMPLFEQSQVHIPSVTEKEPSTSSSSPSHSLKRSFSDSNKNK